MAPTVERGMGEAMNGPSALLIAFAFFLWGAISGMILVTDTDLTAYECVRKTPDR